MNNQQTVYNIEKEIAVLDKTLSRLKLILGRLSDPHQARDLQIAIHDLSIHRQELENIMEDCKTNSTLTK